MHIAACCNHFEIVKLLIEKGAHFDAIDDVSGTMISTDLLLTLSTASILAPWSISSFTISACPSHAAYLSGVTLF